jgi:hypothetical protein
MTIGISGPHDEEWPALEPQGNLADTQWQK